MRKTSPKQDRVPVTPAKQIIRREMDEALRQQEQAFGETLEKLKYV